MYRWLTILLILFVCFTSFTSEIEKYPQNDFIAPVKTALRLSGTFGELRSNHFHAGIDIKGAIGVPLYSIADGYVYRIKVEAGGYGNVLYINHPNGYTSVYAHMNRFSKEIEDYIKEVQYKTEQFGQDLYPPVDSFSFEQGDKIGEMGTTGYSFGPHLHFEIRDTKTEKIINPLLFGFKVPDSRAPRLHQLRVYELNDSIETRRAFSLPLNWGRGTYKIDRDTLMVNSDIAGFALKAYDHMDGVSNWNGIYKLETFVNDSLYHRVEMETYGFNETRYLNAHIDYEEQVTKNSWFNRCYVMPGNQLSMHNGGRGVINLSPGKAKAIKMIASDVEGNKSVLNFWVKRSTKVQTQKGIQIFNYVLPYNEESIINNFPLYLHFKKGAFYENLYLNYKVSNEKSFNVYSSVHSLHNYKTPVHNYFDIGIFGSDVPDSLRSKAFIAYCDEDQDIVNCGGRWEAGYLKARSRTLGDYCIMLDQVPPKIVPINFKKDMKRSSTIRFKISDNYPTTGDARGLSYRATVDGQWILMRFDAKNDLLTYRFDDKVKPGNHTLRLEVTDDRNNVAVFEKDFLR